MNLKEIKEILEMMEAHGLTEFELEKNGVKLKLSKSASGNITVTPQGFSAPMMSMAAPGPMQAAAPQVAGPAAEDPNVFVVRSPMVGTFYAAPAPDKPPYVQKNDTVQTNDVLCIIEAMKLMNEIKSEVSGKIIEILVNNGEPVEFDQPLFKVQKA
jgi:acetyl-CoA carboxylase biotin carboxyl carrier protein